ncbi:hypothetical protein VP1G_01039 [Cytospora mali]|uniref:FAD-binding PCMH-type domain-containing protein n=1 Tax=Cytospora mali TaxID=578113 RepID=A0A194UPA5_CYTMA|nr:hypothetical protein VP1G_01039 [Valsa mali var. pyri (nom. inval.)]
MRSYIHLTLPLLALLAPGPTLGASENLTALYASGLSSGAQIYYATDINWDTEVTQRWTIDSEPTFYGAIKPAIEADIQHIVNISAAYRVPFLATAGGHGFSTTLGKLHNGLEIDLSNFNSVELDASNNELTVGGATVFSDLYTPLYDAGKLLPMGNAGCVGTMGATLGATVGPWQGILGLGIDALLSVRLVTASGSLVTASETENSELFWGLRGAGHSFGIVTSATFKVYDAPNNGNLTSTDFLFEGVSNGSVWEALKSFDDFMPNELSLTFFTIFNSSTSTANIYVNALYWGDSLEAAQYISAFQNAGPVATDQNIVPWTSLQDVAYFGLGATLAATSCGHGIYTNSYGLGLKQSDVATFTSYFNDATQFWTDNPEITGSLVVQRYPNTVTLSVPDDFTAYPHRQIKTQL